MSTSLTGGARAGGRDLEALARILAADRPFGDSAYIHRQLQQASARRLRRVAPDLPVAGALADALAGAGEEACFAVLEDPVLRATTQHALTEQLTGRTPGLSHQECAAVMREALEHVERGAHGSLTAAAAPSCVPLGPEPWHGWIWSEPGHPSGVSTAFSKLIELNFGGELARPSAAQVAVLQRARELIEELTPELGASALGHAHGIGVFPSSGRWQTMAGASQFWITGAVFLAGSMLEDPWWVAEHLLHEALHQKLYDLRHTHSVLLRDAVQDAGQGAASGGRVVSLWNKVDARGSSCWGVSRSLAAFHVYVHLAVYAQLAEAQFESSEPEGAAPYGARGVVLAPSAFRRATYLGQQLAEHYWDDLGPAGQALVDWLMQCLEALEPLPAAEPLRLALLLERYGREAQRLEAAARAGAGAATSPVSADLVESRVAAETAEAAFVLTGAGLVPDAPPPAWRTAPDDATPGERVVAASRQRVRIRDALGAALDGGELRDDAALAEAARLIERSSLELMPILSPDAAPAGDAADRRGDLLTLTDIIGDGVGTSDFCLFLHSLVRMHAPASIVELGTGRGTCAFWMALAAARNGTGHVWTVDERTLRQDWERLLSAHRVRLRATAWSSLAEPGGEPCLETVRRELGLQDTLTFVSRTIDLADPHHFDDYPFATPVDLLFSDFRHGATAVLQILAHFLPRMAPASSILIDGASTSWPSYLLLEQLVTQLNDHRIPALLQEHSAAPLSAAMEGRRLRLVHLTDRNRSVQNSTAWLLLEPDDLRPHPLTAMRGLAV